jgi:hypothetical protein
MKLRAGYDVRETLRVGGEAQVWQRLAGERLLVGGKRTDGFAGARSCCSSTGRDSQVPEDRRRCT